MWDTDGIMMVFHFFPFFAFYILCPNLADLKPSRFKPEKFSNEKFINLAATLTCRSGGVRVVLLAFQSAPSITSFDFSKARIILSDMKPSPLISNQSFQTAAQRRLGRHLGD